MGYPEAQYVIDEITKDLDNLGIDINAVKSKTSNHGYVVLTSSNTQTWTCPEGISKVFVVLVGGSGGGGGGGGGDYAPYNYGSGGGSGGAGGSGAVIAMVYPVKAGQQYTLTCGGGGSAGTKGRKGVKDGASSTSGTAGKKGGNSVFGPIIANGGGGGAGGIGGAVGGSTVPAGGAAGTLTLDSNAVILFQTKGTAGENGSSYRYQASDRSSTTVGGSTVCDAMFVYGRTTSGGAGGYGGSGRSEDGGNGSSGAGGFAMIIW